MPLVTVENLSSGLAQPGGNSFGPVSQFTSTLSSELILSPGSRVSLKRARFLVSADTYTITPSNNKWAALINYASNDAPPAGYSELLATNPSSGIVAKGEIPVGFYSGEDLANAIQKSLNEETASFGIFDDKDPSWDVDFIDGAVSAPGKDSFNISLSSFGDVTIVDPAEMPGSLGVYGVGAADSGKPVGPIFALGSTEENYLTLQKSALPGVDNVIKLTRHPSVNWTEAYGAVNNLSAISTCVDPYSILPIPVDGVVNPTTYTASMPVRYTDGTDGTDNPRACIEQYTMSIGLMTANGAIDLVDKNGTASGFPFINGVNLTQPVKGLRVVAAIRGTLTPGTKNADTQLDGTADFNLNVFSNTDANTNFAEADIAAFEAASETSPPFSYLDFANPATASFKSNAPGSLTDELIPFSVSCTRLITAGTSYKLEFSLDFGGKFDEYGGSGATNIGVVTPAFSVTFDEGYFPVILLSSSFAPLPHIPTIDQSATAGVGTIDIWANVLANGYKKSTTDASNVHSAWTDVGMFTSVDPLTHADDEGGFEALTESVVVYADDDVTPLPATATVSFYVDPNGSQEIDVSHIATGAEFDIVLTSDEWIRSIVHYLDVFPEGDTNKDLQWIAPLRIRHGKQIQLGDPFATRAIKHVGYSGGDRSHPSWGVAKAKHGHHNALEFFSAIAPGSPNFIPLVYGGWTNEPITYRARFTKLEGEDHVVVGLPHVDISGYDTALRTTPLTDFPLYDTYIPNFHADTRSVVFHASNLRSNPGKLVTYKGTLGRHLLRNGVEPYHADENTDVGVFIGASNRLQQLGANTYEGVYLYLNQLFSMMGFYVPGLSSNNVSWLNFKTASDTFSSNTAPTPFEFESGLCVQLRNVPIHSFLPNGQKAPVIEFIDDYTSKTAVFSRIITGRDQKMFELLYEPEDATDHIVNTTQMLRYRNLDIGITDFSGRELSSYSNTGSTLSPLYSVSLTFNFVLPNPLLERIAAHGEQDAKKAKLS